MFPASFISDSVNYDASSIAFFNRVTAAGGSLSITEKNAVNQLVVSLKANSLWTPMLAIYPFVGGTSASCAQNLVSSSYTGSFVGTWTINASGVKGNNIDTWMDTGLAPGFAGASLGLSVYANLLGTANGMFDVSNDSGQITRLLSNTTTVSAYAYDTTQAVFSYANTTGGLFGLNVLSGTTKAFKNGVVKINTPTIGTYATGENFWLGGSAFYNSGVGDWTYSSASNARYGFCAMHSGLSDAQALNLYTAVQACQTTLGRNV